MLVAGTSAGAAMMGSSMIASGDSDENPRTGSVELAPGTNFVGNAIVDTHFSQRGRHGRMLAAIGHYPQIIGFGIDENTAMIVENNKLIVVGDGAVTIFDGAAISHTTVPAAKSNESLSLFDIKLHVLSQGHGFDLLERTPFVEPAAKPRGKAQSTIKEEK